MKRICTVLCPLPLLLLACGNSDETTETNGGVNPADLSKNPIQGVGTPKMLIETGQYTDGPVWHEGEGVLFFTVPIGTGDVPGLYRVRPDGSAMKVRGGDIKSGALPVGNAVDKKGSLITVEAKRVLRGGGDGQQQPIATGYPGASGVAPFDTLNDAVVHENGTIFVTDPGYFAEPAPDTNRLYRIAPDGAVTVAEAFQNVPRPNGLALSPDQKILYVGFERPAAGTKPYIEKYFVKPDGTLAEHSKFVELDVDSSPDGIEVDAAGNLYIANKAGVTVFKSDGKKIGNVAVPEQPTGLAFGGEGMKTLFITTQGTKIYTLKVNVPGVNQ
ncbi:MAG: SMP-30/gluconolactonase/LRE family protein [Deltaproteobacteria bacterium]|nr:SMP-30/gluconolactonase/LRE family protein [Deltaproteobacteria bacterium]